MQNPAGCPTQPSGIRDGTNRALVSMDPGGFWVGVGGLWVTNYYQLPPPRCRMYGFIPLARLQPKTLYNASWSSPTTTLTPSPQSPAPSKLRQKQHPWKWPPQREASQHPNKANATALQAPMASLRSDMDPTVHLEVTHPGLQGPRGGLNYQGEIRT